MKVFICVQLQRADISTPGMIDREETSQESGRKSILILTRTVYGLHRIRNLPLAEPSVDIVHCLFSHG